RIMAITSAFQADDAGSIPATRSRETSLIAALAYFYCVGTVFYLSSGYGSKPVIVTVLIFYNSGMAHCRWRFCISWQGR
ncbi:hypothetical protein, partial [Escherichia coli]